MALERGGVIINADSMQVYSVLRVLTARPGKEELSRAPHHLYGHVHPSIAYSTGAWLRDVEALVESGELAGRTAIFVGGTGLYFRALLGGLAEMPAIPKNVRDRWRHELSEQGADGLHAVLTRGDPQAAMRIRPTDGQRIVRALEILEVTGRPISELQAEGGRPLVEPDSADCYLMEPDRPFVHARINERFDRMLAEGALDEVKQLMHMNLDPSLPAMKAIGVRELQAAMAGEIGMAEAIERAKAATRQYAKRQATWFRHQLGPNWKRVRPAN
jgi:tRNA dimethylallyltransferase